MGDGWETKRSYSKDHQDWVIIKLCVFLIPSIPLNFIHSNRGAPAYLATAIIDTIHFKGNFPESCDIRGIYNQEREPDVNNGGWKMILSPAKLSPNRMHFFQLNGPSEKYTHVKVSIYPDGGIKRVRIIGTLAAKIEPGAAETTASLREDGERHCIIVEEGWEILEGNQG